MSEAPAEDAPRPLRVVGVSGSLHEPSRTTALVREILGEVGRRTDAETSLFEIATLGPAFAGALKRSELPPHVEAALVQIEEADLLVVASPVYRASFTGLFKHLFDFVGQYALTGTPVLLAATGGGERHALILEHQLRPLFAFFQALSLPGGIYASDTDFTAYELTSAEIRARIEQTVGRALPIVERSANVIPSAYISTW